ncbi:MAG: preprotein translocase subunit SecA, partial [Synechococcaceae bacterium WB9_4xB_025]|nr:preprotein translocase subunit SecA [Synechococcaceae bacterium WB9_4xB_025]
MWKQLLGDPAKQQLRRYKPLIAAINRLEPELQSFSDDELRQLTGEFRERLSKVAISNLREKQLLDELLPQVYALVREGSRRVLGLRHHDVQLLGGCILHHGGIAEMQTGEGKTLVSTLPAFLNALPGKGVHAVTANDYLARRDAELMGQVHRFLGLSVGLIQSTMQPQQRRNNYNCDITYATNSELGFDFLRDNMAGDVNQLVQRPPYYCIIDEVDSILIDEARTPLIISGKVERPKQKFVQAAAVAAQLVRGQEADDDGNDAEGDYEVDEKQRRCSLTDQGYANAEALLGVQDLFNPQNPWAHFILNALSAKELFVRDVDYIVRDQEVVIVDQGTGRVMAGRRWSDGQHQALEAKEGVPIQDETETLAAITYQNYFRLYERLAGMTGTGKTEA